MNYRHAFHAGNFADVVKHAVLALVVEHLKRKDAAFRIIDTHAGIGLYDLGADEPSRTGEWRDGIGRLYDVALPEAAAALEPWLAAVRGLNGDGPLRCYPGSPALVRHLMRRQDRLTAVELHPADAEALKLAFAGDVQVRTVALDGWLALKAFLPPKERRGAVIVDPPYEEPDEIERLGTALIEACRRWSGGTYVGWYPIKQIGEISRLHARLAALPKVVAIDLLVRAPSPAGPLPGAGMVVINPPWTLAAAMAPALDWLAGMLAQGRGAEGRVSVIADA